MRNCVICGTELRKDALYCHECGARSDEAPENTFSPSISGQTSATQENAGLFQRMKDFFAPVSTFEEAKTRKKTLLVALLINLGILVVFGVVNTLITAKIVKEIADIFLVLSSLIFIVTIMLIFALNRAIKRYKDTICKNCQSVIRYDGNTSYKVLYKTTTRKHNPKTGESAINEYQVAEIHCKCQQCGTEKTFKHKFLVNRTTAYNGIVNSSNNGKSLGNFVVAYFNDPNYFSDSTAR